VIPIAAVRERGYFTDKNHGHFCLNGEKSWAIKMTCMAEIDPADFKLAADYLYTGDFGHRIISEETRDEALDQCVAAWEVGEKMGMCDLLDHIVEKMKNLMPWAQEEVAVLAMMVYKINGAPLDAYQNIKDLISDYIADNFYDMIRDQAESFQEYLRNTKELARDVYGKMADRAK
jgi:hypothetical protein